MCDGSQRLSDLLTPLSNPPPRLLGYPVRSVFCGLSRLDSIFNYIHPQTFYCHYVYNGFQTFYQRSYLGLRQLVVALQLKSIISVYHLLPAAPCSANTFFCHSNMCINNSLVCNGVQNCVYPWDENHCKGKPLSFMEVLTLGCLG